MFHKLLRISALVAAIALAVGVTFGGRVSALFNANIRLADACNREANAKFSIGTTP